MLFAEPHFSGCVVWCVMCDVRTHQTSLVVFYFRRHLINLCCATNMNVGDAHKIQPVFPCVCVFAADLRDFRIESDMLNCAMI